MRRSLALLLLLLGALVVGYWLWPRERSGPAMPASSSAAPLRTAAPEATASAVPPAPAPRSPVTMAGPAGGVPSTPSAVAPAAASPATLAADYPLSAPLNAPDSTVIRDLETLQHLFENWRSNFPREGNPVGENVDITAALTGRNPLGLALLPKNHPAINARGELCDRWGTPFRFHQLSGERMEVRSAGPDRRFATADDAVWTPQ